MTVTALPGDLPHIARQLIVGSGITCAFGCAEFCGGRIVRHLHLDDEQLCTVPAGESGGLADGPIGGFGAVGADHHAPNGVTTRWIRRPLVFTIRHGVEHSSQLVSPYYTSQAYDICIHTCLCRYTPRWAYCGVMAYTCGISKSVHIHPGAVAREMQYEDSVII